MATERKENTSDGLTGRILHYAGVLTAVCLLSGAGVSLLYVAGAERIGEQKQKAFEGALEVVIGEAGDPEELIEGRLWAAHLPENGGVRYVAEGIARGYQSDIRVMVSVDAESPGSAVASDARIHRLVVLSSAETPGLGENINLVRRTVSLWEAILGRREPPGRPNFQTRFSGKSIDELVLEEEGGAIEPVTGATESSRAVVEAARRALSTILEETGRLYGE